MLIPLTLPPPVRQFLADGVQLLFARLAALTEEFRAGLIAAIGRTVADGAECLMDRVFPPGRRSYADEPIVNAFDNRSDPSPVNDGSNEPIPYDTHDRRGFDSDDSLNGMSPEWKTTDSSPPSHFLTRALVAAGLNALGVWLLRIGLVPTSAVAAMLGGIVLLSR
jgi:hypothetical protein